METEKVKYSQVKFSCLRLQCRDNVVMWSHLRVSSADSLALFLKMQSDRKISNYWFDLFFCVDYFTHLTHIASEWMLAEFPHIVSAELKLCTIPTILHQYSDPGRVCFVLFSKILRSEMKPEN